MIKNGASTREEGITCAAVLLLRDESVMKELIFMSTSLLFLIKINKKLKIQNMTLYCSFSLVNELEEKN